MKALKLIAIISILCMGIGDTNSAYADSDSFIAKVKKFSNHKLTGAEVKALFVGNSLIRDREIKRGSAAGTRYSVTYYFRSANELVVSNNLNYASRPTSWSVTNTGKFCFFSHRQNQEICKSTVRVSIGKEGMNVDMARQDGSSVWSFRILEGKHDR